MSEMETVVGLEVHCQLATASKLFCPCPASSLGAPPNSAACPVCTGQPGTLPVLNRRAVELAFTAALALDCRLRPRSVFARKNYFYPDLPKGYQISQYEEPFSEAGRLALPGSPEKTVRIHRIHMEEDAGKLLHDIGSERLDGSLVDFNRAGVPLIEIVSEPDMRSPDEAFRYLTRLKEILQFAGVSRCDMEKGEMRCDANVSVRPAGAAAFGTKVEVKNMNSFRGVRDAIEFEARRQAQALARGERVIQETRLWDAENRRTSPMRSKEEAHDYRYFPEPDIPPLAAEEGLVAALRARLPKLPALRRAEWQSRHPELSADDREFLSATRERAEVFEAAAAGVGAGSVKLLASYLQVNPQRSEEAGPAFFIALVGLTEARTISATAGKQIINDHYEPGKTPEQIVRERGLSQVSDSSQLSAWVQQAIDENPKAAEDVRAGKERAIGALVGAVMKKSKGTANPALVNDFLKERLK